MVCSRGGTGCEPEDRPIPIALRTIGVAALPLVCRTVEVVYRTVEVTVYSHLSLCDCSFLPRAALDLLWAGSSPVGREDSFGRAVGAVRGPRHHTLTYDMRYTECGVDVGRAKAENGEKNVF